MSTRGDGETVNVRRATVADAATISALNADVQAVHAAALPWLFKTPSVDTFPPATAGAMLARDDVLVYLAYLGDAPSVLPSLRGRGIGGALLGAVRQAADDRDIRQVPTTNDYGCADQQTDQVRRPASELPDPGRVLK